MCISVICMDSNSSCYVQTNEIMILKRRVFELEALMVDLQEREVLSREQVWTKLSLLRWVLMMIAASVC